MTNELLFECIKMILCGISNQKQKKKVKNKTKTNEKRAHKITL